MIIDAILDAKYSGTLASLDYIKEEADIFKMDYIIKAINTRNRETIREALKKYIDKNGYNPDIKKDIDKLKIEL